MPVFRALLYLATAAAVSLVARGIFFGPPPLWITLGALSAYVALVLCGVFFMRLSMFADVFWRGQDDVDEVALTFDDGPSPEHTPLVLDMLDKAKVSATFFVIGRKALAHPEIVKAIVEKGHALGLHSFAHDRLFSLRGLKAVREDLQRGVQCLEGITGQKPRLFRPPIGHSNPRIAKAAHELGLVFVGWSVRALDGLESARPEGVAKRVRAGLKPGAVVLLHDAAERDNFRPASLDALPSILKTMRERGYKGVRVDRWLDAEMPEGERE